MNYAKLKGLVREKFGFDKHFALALGISRGSLSAKLNNKSQWTQKQMNKAMKLLDITPDKLGTYFLTENKYL